MKNRDTFTKLPNPDILPTDTGYSCSFSPDGNYLTVAHVVLHILQYIKEIVILLLN